MVRHGNLPSSSFFLNEGRSWDSNLGPPITQSHPSALRQPSLAGYENHGKWWDHLLGGPSCSWQVRTIRKCILQKRQKTRIQRSCHVKFRAGQSWPEALNQIKWVKLCNQKVIKSIANFTEKFYQPYIIGWTPNSMGIKPIEFLLPASKVLE